MENEKYFEVNITGGGLHSEIVACLKKLVEALEANPNQEYVGEDSTLYSEITEGEDQPD